MSLGKSALLRTTLAIALALILSGVPAGSSFAVPIEATRVQALVESDPNGALELIEGIQALGGANEISPDDIARLGANKAIFPRLMRALDRLDYAPSDLGGHIDWLWLRWAINRHADDPAAAKRATRRLRSVYSVIEARLDGRLDAIVNRGDPNFDPRGHAMKRGADLRRWIAQHPNSLRAANEMTGMRIILGDFATALEEIAVSRTRAARQQYADTELNLVDLHTQRAIVLFALGRHDEALAGLREDAAVEREGALTTFTALTYAGALTNSGRAEEALVVLNRFEPQSKSDLAWLALRRICALAALNRRDEGRALLPRLESESWQGTLLYEALLCLDDYDRAASAIVEQLEDPVRRGAALVRLSEWNYAPNPNRGQRLLQERSFRVQNRQDVRTAIAKIGRTEPIDLIF